MLTLCGRGWGGVGLGDEVWSESKDTPLWLVGRGKATRQLETSKVHEGESRLQMRGGKGVRYRDGEAVLSGTDGGLALASKGLLGRGH